MANATTVNTDTPNHASGVTSPVPIATLTTAPYAAGVTKTLPDPQTVGTVGTPIVL